MPIGGRINSPHVATSVADESIDSDAYVDGSIDTAHLAADAVDGTKLADNAVDSEHYTDGSIDADHIASNAVTTAKINADAVTGAKIADDAIDSEHYADGSIDNAHIADDAIDSEHYAAGSIDTAHIADNQVTVAKLADIARGSLIVGNASAASAELTVGSDNQVLTVDANGDIGWEAAAGGGDVVDDTTPQLGGDLDANGSDITGVGSIVFLATQSADADANALDDYEEGTFTPQIGDQSLDGTGESQTYTSQYGRYTKIGQKVFFTLLLGVNSLGTLSTGNSVAVLGLPFTQHNVTYGQAAVSVPYGYSFATGGSYSLGGEIPLNTSHILLKKWDATTGASYLTIAQYSAGGTIQISGHYDIA